MYHQNKSLTDRFFFQNCAIWFALMYIVSNLLAIFLPLFLQQENFVIQPNVFPFTYELCQAKWSPQSVWLKRVAKYTFAHPVSGILYHVSLFIIIIIIIIIFTD